MPGPIGFNLDGANIVRPGVSSKIDASAMVASRRGPGGVVGVVAASDGGDPSQVYEFSSFAEAKAVIRGGAVLSFLARIFQPSPDYPGASTVRFVRVGVPVAATLAAAGMTFTASDFGRHTNGISIKVVANGSTWDVTVTKAAENYVRVYNVGNGLSVTSSATTPKIVFDHATREAKLYENAVVVATLSYPTDNVTLANLAAFINGRAGWTASVTGDPSMPVRFMDNPLLAAAPAITAAPTSIPASQGALVYATANDPHVDVALTAGTTYATLSAVAETALSGGTGTANDAMQTSDWTAALAKMESVQIHHLFLATTDAAAHASARAHCIALRQANRKRWRIFYAGGAVGQTVAQAITAAQALDGPVVYCWNGTTCRNPLTGLQENLGGLGVAAQLCGLSAGTPSSEPATNKPIISEGLDVPSPQDSDIDKLLIAGVTPVVNDPVLGRAIIVQAITTWQGGANVSFRKLQGLRIQDDLQRLYQAVLSDFVGKPMDLATAYRIKGRIAKALDGATRSAANPDGFLTEGFQGGKVLPAWLNLSVSADGIDLWSIGVEAHPVGESAYIVVRTQLTPATIQL